MSLIKVDTNSISVMYANLSRQCDVFEEVLSQIRNARSELDMRVSTARQINESLTDIEIRTRRQLERLNSYIASLNDVINRFVDSDKIISERAKDINYMLEKMIYRLENGYKTKETLGIGTAWQSIAAVSAVCGINSSLINRTDFDGYSDGNASSFFDYSHTPSASLTYDWLGYELSDGNPGVTAWVGKASAEAQNEWGYAGVNAYLGKVEAKTIADASIMKTTTKKEYIDGKWVEKNRTDFITAVAGASASVSALSGDVKAGVGSDQLGIEGKAEGSVGIAKAEAKGTFSVSEDGVNANVKGEAMVSAVEGEASSSINILGLEITGKVGGYAGAVGVKGKLGIEDNKFVLEGGAAALIGGSVGIEIGFNDEGWDNFVDFIVFWN